MLNQSPRIREFIAWTIYPLVFGGGLLLAYYWLYVQNRPIDSITIVIIGAAAIVLVMEFVSPYRAQWRPTGQDLKTDITYLLLYQVFGIIERTIAPIIGLYFVTSMPQIGSYWPSEWPVFIQLLLAIHIYDFIGYWLHRLGHKVPVLWRLHAVHHSPDKLWFGNAPRFHVIETLYQIGLASSSLYILGADHKITALTAVWISIHGVFQHCNIYFKIGIFNYVFSQAELHRWHHSRLIEESDTNFGNNVIFWDILFGTFFYPKDREIATIGLVGETYPTNFFGQFLAPFQPGFVDKPVDFKGNEQLYEDRIREANQQLASELGIKN